MTPSREPLAGACLLLFGTIAPPHGLDADCLRAAYRRMAVLTHPDARQRDPAGRDFIRVHEAYLLLRAHLAPVHLPRAPARPAAGASPPRRGRETHGAATAGGAPGPWFWTGRVPHRRLRLGEYLFYTGAISWDTLIGAIVAQRRARPTLGQLARRRRLVDEASLAAALAARRPGERLGEALLRLSFLSARAVEELLDEQRRLQGLLGRHAARIGGLSLADLSAALVALRGHNRGVPPRA